MSQVLFRNISLLDPRWNEPRGGYEVLVEGETIREVSDRPIRAPGARVVDGGGRTLLPGLIDCHVHTMHSEVYVNRLETVPLTLMAAHAAERLKRMLDRGFTTVRDAGGADWGIKAALEAGLIPGPRLFISGRSIGPTGGHNDRNRRTQIEPVCNCCNAMVFLRSIADGADEVRKAAREQLRQGADQVKFMVSGGVASPYDPLESRQFTVEEMSAGVEEAVAFGRYALAHAYTPEAITRAMTAGVRTIEHGNLVDAQAAALMASKGAYMVPNLVAYVVMKERAASYGMTADMLDKNEHVLKSGYAELELCRAAGVKMGYGSDLLGALENEQSREFLIRREVMPAIDVLRSATLVGAEIVRREGKLGVIEPGAFADLLLVDGDPLKDFGCLQDGGAHFAAIMKGGAFHKYAV
ncbi:amidohydrolase family protein [Reyranella sp. CPCC 100927]|uniref:metal-dependent hydrolase family protein n=1 Tax=Reyranella sp. CPCC 100927 TaxID=2599616 RepID=UPI0011B3943F|nr:amidohydrolase family protein [Reyranella sp. CPCC 100927]TWT15461.1 amidohydrolase family protein [Reyranella sp. CPCC 100927]